MNEKGRCALPSAAEQNQWLALHQRRLSHPSTRKPKICACGRLRLPQPGSKVGHRVSLKNRRERHPAPELFFDPSHELDREQRVTAEFEESIADADRSHVKKLLENAQ